MLNYISKIGHPEPVEGSKKINFMVRQAHHAHFFLLFFIVFFITTQAWAQTINVKPAEVLKVIFKDSKSIVSEKKTLTPDQQSLFKKQLGYDPAKLEWTFYIAKSDNKIDGYAVIDHELGKMEPITFLTAMTSEGAVKVVEILVYREPYGSEVHEKKFMRQYEGKKAGAPLKVGQDIQNMSGATISSRSVTTGVKRDLALWNIFYGTH